MPVLGLKVKIIKIKLVIIKSYKTHTQAPPPPPPRTYIHSRNLHTTTHTCTVPCHDCDSPLSANDNVAAVFHPMFSNVNNTVPCHDILILIHRSLRMIMMVMLGEKQQHHHYHASGVSHSTVSRHGTVLFTFENIG